MQYGVVFPQTEFGNDPSAIKDYAQTAEALGSPQAHIDPIRSFREILD
jgi:hypothetical protein